MQVVRGAWRNGVERSCESGILVGLVAFSGLLLEEIVAEELVLAEEVLSRFLIVVGAPIAWVVFEVFSVGVGEIVGRGVNVVVYLREIVLIVVVIAVAAVAVSTIAITAVTAIATA